DARDAKWRQRPVCFRPTSPSFNHAHHRIRLQTTQPSGTAAASLKEMTQTESRVDSVAIVGMAGRFPGARDVPAFWENLVAGKDCVTRFSDEQLASAGYNPAAVRKLP